MVYTLGLDKIIIECDCTSELFSAHMFVETNDSGTPYTDVYISHSVGLWYSEQDSILKKIFYRFKVMWYLLRGKQYQFNEVIISNSYQLRMLGDFFTKASGV